MIFISINYLSLQVHKWVNFNSMLAKCYLGPLKPDSVKERLRQSKRAPPKMTSDGFLVPSKLYIYSILFYFYFWLYIF